MSKSVAAVLGGTGHNGGSVVDALLASGKFDVRVLSRNPDSDAAKKLAARGVHVFKGDVSSDEGLAPFFTGATHAYLLTAFWDPATMRKEVPIGIRIVEACVAAKVKHVIWSTLADVQKATRGTIDVPHFTDKAYVEYIIRGKMLGPHPSFESAIFLGPAFYYTNFWMFQFLKRGDDGKLALNVPGPVPLCYACAIEDIGSVALKLWQEPHKHNLKSYIMMAKKEPFENFAKEMGEHFKEEVKVNWIPMEAVRKASEETAVMFEWFRDYSYSGDVDDTTVKSLVPLTSFAAWLKKTNAQAPPKK